VLLGVNSKRLLDFADDGHKKTVKLKAQYHGFGCKNTGYCNG
jgi:hypothetical protein